MPERKFPYGVDPGDLPHIVTLQRPATPIRRDDVGERIDEWTDVETVHARVAPLSGREQFLADQIQAATTHTVTVRYSPKNRVADSSWRVKFGTRLFYLDRPPTNLEERNVWLVMNCEEGLVR